MSCDSNNTILDNMTLYDPDEMDPSTIFERIQGLVEREERYYRKRDYYYNSSNTVSPIMMDTYCREQMIIWCYDVLDFCNLHSTTTEIALSYIDRYIAACVFDDSTNTDSTSSSSCQSVLYDRRQYQLCCITSLYIAIKIHEPICIDITLLSKLSHGSYTPVEIEQMERSILSKLQWHIHPPTIDQFLHYYINLVLPPTTTVSQQDKDVIIDVAASQCATALCNYHVNVNMKASTIAYCALLNALELINIVDYNRIIEVINTLSNVLNVTSSTDIDESTKFYRLKNWLLHQSFAVTSLPSSSSSSIGTNPLVPTDQSTPFVGPYTMIPSSPSSPLQHAHQHLQHQQPVMIQPSSPSSSSTYYGSRVTNTVVGNSSVSPCNNATCCTNCTHRTVSPNQN